MARMGCNFRFPLLVKTCFTELKRAKKKYKPILGELPRETTDSIMLILKMESSFD